MNNRQNHFPDLIICTAAPRSGLSVLSGCLKILEIKLLGDEKLAGAETIDSLLFQELGRTPFMAGPFPRGWKESEAAVMTRKRIGGLLNSMNAPTQLTVHPQTLPVWLECIAEQGLQAELINLVRHPHEVALSLLEQSGLELYKGHLLWLSCVREALTALEGKKNSLITFDQLLADPVTSLYSISASLLSPGFQIPSSDLLDFVQPALRHFHASDMTEENKQAFTPYAKLYSQLRLVQIDSRLVEVSPPEKGYQANLLFNEFNDALFQAIGNYENQLQCRLLTSAAPTASREPLYTTFFIPNAQREYTEVRSLLIIDQWQKITCAIPRPELLEGMPLKLAPLNIAGSVSMTEASLIRQTDGQTVWSVTDVNDHQAVTLEGAALRLPSRERIDLLIMEPEAHVALHPGIRLTDCPLRIELWIKASPSYAPFAMSLQNYLELDNWEKILANRSDYQKLDMSLRRALAELAMQQGEWAEAIRRWQDLAAFYGQDTPKAIYDRLDQAYKLQQKFPKGSPEEELRLGDMSKYDLLSVIHKELRPELYLEIGVQKGVSLKLARCRAIGIDPMPQADPAAFPQAEIIATTSDDFFATQVREVLTTPPDLVFIDGMHLFEYALRDFMNTEKHAVPWTLVAIDDIFPCHPAQAERRRRTSAWTGDVWKLYRILQEYRPNLMLLPVNTSPTGLLLIAGLDPANQTLHENYDLIVRKYSSDMDPPEEILKRTHVYPSDHPAIANLLQLLLKVQQANFDSASMRKLINETMRDFPKKILKELQLQIPMMNKIKM